ncbi:MAG TPA: transglutaminase family protein [Candidatus Dormibacteraeota bacterium]|nr:transglutaminase family protein [Candidatus Dormibacteraeota bacterium]
MKLPLDLDGAALGEQLASASLDAAQVDWAAVRRSAYLIHQRISYRYEGPVRQLRQRLVVQPRAQHGDQRRLRRHFEVLHASPQRVADIVDGFGNHVVDIAIPVVPEEVTFISWSVVERDAEHGPHLAASQDLRDPRLLTPTRLTAADSDLRDLAQDLATTGIEQARLAEIVCARVHQEMRYQYDVTGIGTTAADAFRIRSGVCQDYAHVMLALTRELGMPSRYVSGQLVGSGGSHAWVEVLIPHSGGSAQVISLDPTHNRLTDMTYLTVAVGRDYSDVAPLSGSYRAPYAGRLSTTKQVCVVSLDSDLQLESSA